MNGNGSILVSNVMRYNEDIDIHNVHTDVRYGKMAKDFYFDEKCSLTRLLIIPAKFNFTYSVFTSSSRPSNKK